MSDNLNKVVEEILDDYLEYDENGNSFMNSEEFEKLTDGKYERYDPRDRLAQALTTLIEKEVDKALMRLDDAYSRNLPELVNNEKIKAVIEEWQHIRAMEMYEEGDYYPYYGKDGQCLEAYERIAELKAKLKKGSE